MNLTPWRLVLQRDISLRQLTGYRYRWEQVAIMGCRPAKADRRDRWSPHPRRGYRVSRSNIALKPSVALFRLRLPHQRPICVGATAAKFTPGAGWKFIVLCHGSFDTATIGGVNSRDGVDSGRMWHVSSPLGIYCSPNVSDYRAVGGTSWKHREDVVRNPPRQFKRLIRRTSEDGESQYIRIREPIPLAHIQTPGYTVVLWVDSDDVLVTLAAADRFEQWHAAGREPEQRVNIFRQTAVQPPIHGRGQLHERNA